MFFLKKNVFLISLFSITHANQWASEADNIWEPKKTKQNKTKQNKTAIKSKFDFSSQIQRKTNEHLA